MNEQTDKLIRDLADKLGTTAEHLWGVLVRQAPIFATCQLALLIVAAVFTASMLQLTCFFARKYEKAACDDGYVIPIALSGMACLVGTFCAASILTNANLILAGFFNPEYWALSRIYP